MTRALEVIMDKLREENETFEKRHAEALKIIEELRAVQRARAGDVFQEVRAELERARSLHPNPQNSAHEGYAVILEELDELWEEVRKKRSPERTAAMREEAIQVAAMCIRFVEDVCDRSNRP